MKVCKQSLCNEGEERKGELNLAANCCHKCPSKADGLQQRSQPPRSGGGGKERWGSGGETPGEIFGTTPLRTLGDAHFEYRNAPI